VATIVRFSQVGQRYGLGQTGAGYGIWAIGEPAGPPLESFPADEAGWGAAYARWQALEAGTTEPVRSRAISRRTTAIGLQTVGVALGIVGLFPTYLDGRSLASSGDELVAHLFYLVGFALAGALLIGPAARQRRGALFGVGVAIITLGFFVSDLGNAVTTLGKPVGAGFYLSLVGFLISGIASLIALSSVKELGGLHRFQHGRLPLFIVGGLAAIGAAVTFAPAWDRYLLTAASTGDVRVITAGNAFSNPAPVIAGNLITMGLIVALPLIALAWTPLRNGAVLLIGGLVPLVGQVVSATVQLHEHIAPAMFGVSAAQAESLGLEIHSGLTGVFYGFAALVAVLVALGLVNLLEPSRAR
jgi:hypothetical protein